MTPSILRREALRALEERLARAGVPAPSHDAEALLLHALRLRRALVWAEPDAPLTAEQADRLERLACERERRVPLQWLLGSLPFHGVTLEVRPGVFIPRPETETLVEAAREALGPASRGLLLDLGTGTGAVAVALLAALRGWRGVAVDRSAAALELAARNAVRNGVAGRLFPATGDFSDPAYDPPLRPFDAVLSNPPYIPSGVIASLEPEVRDHDPREALDGGADGLDALRHLARGICRWTRPGAYVALEIGADQPDPVGGMFGPLLRGIRIVTDLAGRPRVLTGWTRGRGA
jgi:release factor glutamine methyltransferase